MQMMRMKHVSELYSALSWKCGFQKHPLQPVIHWGPRKSARKSALLFCPDYLAAWNVRFHFAGEEEQFQALQLAIDEFEKKIC